MNLTWSSFRYIRTQQFIIPGHPISGAKQRRLPAPRQVSESKLSSVLGWTHACATSLGIPEVFSASWTKPPSYTIRLQVAKKHCLFSTDSYHPQSIKTLERLRRWSSETIILTGPATRKPYERTMFRANGDNKKQLWQLQLRVWRAQQAASRLEKTEMSVLIVGEKAHQLV